MAYRSTSEVVLAIHRSYVLFLARHVESSAWKSSGIVELSLRNRGLRCILSNDRFKNEQRNRHYRMIADKNDDGCPALSILFQISKYSRTLFPNFHIFLQCTCRYNVSRKAVYTSAANRRTKTSKEIIFPEVVYISILEINTVK